MTPPLLPCGHARANLALVDERELTCDECGADVNDDTWMCGICYPSGETPAERRLEALERVAEIARGIDIQRVLRAARHAFSDMSNLEELEIAIRSLDAGHPPAGEAECDRSPAP